MFHTLTTRCHASAVYDVVLRLFVTSQCSTETAKCRITQTMPHDSPGTLVFFCQRSWQNSNGVKANGGAKCRWGRL